MGKRGPRLLLEKQSVERRERFRVLWESKNALVHDIAAEFGVSERTAYTWAKAEGLHRRGRGYGKDKLKQQRKLIRYAGQTKAEPYDRALVNAIDEYYAKPAIAAMEGEKPYRIAEAVFREFHNAVKEAGPPVSLDETGQFVEGNQPEPVKGESPDFKVLRRRIERRLTQAPSERVPDDRDD